MCNFKAPELLKVRRSIASNQTLTFTEIGHILRIIDDVRWRHAETTGCNCWNEAVAANPSDLDKREAA